MTSKNNFAVTKPHFVELRLQEINQLFNSMDPSPFREKELDPDAEEFIIDWATELPQDEPLGLKIYLDKLDPGYRNEQEVTDAVRNHFNYRSDQILHHNKQLLKQGWKDLSIGLVFLATCLATAQILGQQSGGTIIAILRESLIIGGWVAMWKPMEYFLYGRWPVKRKQKLYNRLGRIQVVLQSSR